MQESKGLIVFDTNVIEGRYMPALLKGETIRDLRPLKEDSFVPAIMWKSIFEIMHHVKKGQPTFPWMTDDFSYPGGISVGFDILNEYSDFASRENLYYWFGLSQEWEYKNWDLQLQMIEKFVDLEERQKKIHGMEVMKRFAEWRFSLNAFCNRVRKSIEREFKVLYAPLGNYQQYFILVEKISRESLLPNEDLEILCGALFENARAFVTDDSNILLEAGLSLSFDYDTAFVHPNRMEAAASCDFDIRWSYKQTSRR